MIVELHKTASVTVIMTKNRQSKRETNARKRTETHEERTEMDIFPFDRS